MLAFIKKNKIGHLISILPDRLYRNIEDYVELRKTDVNITLHMVYQKHIFALNDTESFEAIYQHEIIELENLSTENGAMENTRLKLRSDTGTIA